MQQEFAAGSYNEGYYSAGRFQNRSALGINTLRHRSKYNQRQSALQRDISNECELQRANTCWFTGGSKNDGNVKTGIFRTSQGLGAALLTWEIQPNCRGRGIQR